MDSNGQIGSSFRSSLISPRTRLLGVLTIELAAVISLRIYLLTTAEVQSYIWTHIKAMHTETQKVDHGQSQEIS